MNFIIYLSIFIFLIYLSEIGGYFWHRFAHNENSLIVKTTHDIHHTIIDDQADGDFFYVCILLGLYLLVLIYFYYKAYITLTLLVILYTAVFFPFVWSYYIHAAYHIEDHWLNKYEWFRNDKRIHMQHHLNPEVNYGIATHFTDELLGTFDYAFPISVNENE